MMAAASQDDLTVFDGGMGHLIKQKDLKLASLDGQQCDKYFLVGAYANVEQPLVVEALHSEFMDAGANVITTNSFAATPWALTSIGKEADLEVLLQVHCCPWQTLALQSSSSWRAVQPTSTLAAVDRLLPMLPNRLLRKRTSLCKLLAVCLL